MQSVGHMFYISAVLQYMTGVYSGDGRVYYSVRTKSLNFRSMSVLGGTVFRV